MGLLDAITGRRRLKGPAPDRLFAITTAYLTLDSGQGVAPAGAAAIVFQALSSADFESALADMEAVVQATAGEAGTTVSHRDDAFGYRWMILRPGQPEDLAVGINAVSSALEAAGFGERLLCAVFAFRDERHGAAPVFLIYNIKRGHWYPFVPRGPQKRDIERELQLRAILGPELPLEPELDRSLPLWGIPL